MKLRLCGRRAIDIEGDAAETQKVDITLLAVQTPSLRVMQSTKHAISR